MIKLDNQTGESSIKLYRNEKGELKGDARIGFAQPESVDTAIQMLDQSHFRENVVINVKQAEFQQKGNEYVPKRV